MDASRLAKLRELHHLMGVFAKLEWHNHIMYIEENFPNCQFSRRDDRRHPNEHLRNYELYSGELRRIVWREMKAERERAEPCAEERRCIVLQNVPMVPPPCDVLIEKGDPWTISGIANASCQDYNTTAQDLRKLQALGEVSTNCGYISGTHPNWCGYKCYWRGCQ